MKSIRYFQISAVITLFITILFHPGCKPQDPGPHKMSCDDSAALARKFVREHGGFNCRQLPPRPPRRPRPSAETEKAAAAIARTIYGGIIPSDANTFLNNYYNSPIPTSELRYDSWLIDARDVVDLLIQAPDYVAPDYIQVFLGRPSPAVADKNNITLVLAGLSSHKVGGADVPHHQSSIFTSNNVQGLAEYVTPCPICPKATDYIQYRSAVGTPVYIPSRRLNVYP